MSLLVVFGTIDNEVSFVYENDFVEHFVLRFGYVEYFNLYKLVGKLIITISLITYNSNLFF